jgi:hypothetical protein
MASTYTTRIGLEKQGDGENANTWGLKLNSNVIDLVDEAIAGYETIDLSSGAVSLTDTDGVPNQARNFGLKFTGALPADTTVTIPAKEKIYYIFNDTTEDYTIFIKPVGGTAVSVVEAGRSMIAATDGSNINLLESVDPDIYATKVEVQAVSATMATSINNTRASLSATMATSINNSNVARAALSATVATSINNSNIAIAANTSSIAVVSSTMATSIANVSATLESRIAATSLALATSISNSNTAIAIVSSTLEGRIATVSSSLNSLDNITYKNNTSNTVSAGTFTFTDSTILSFGTSANSELYNNGSNLYLDVNNSQSFLIRDGADGNTTRFTFDVTAGNFTATGDITAFSDERLKSNIKTLDGNKVFDMRGVSFIKNKKESSGVIAQELEGVAPELVHSDAEYKSVAYGNLVGYLIEAVKLLKEEINELKGK